MHALVDESIYDNGVLHKDVHHRLVADIAHFAREANIPQRMIWSPLRDYCNDEEVEWVRDLNNHAANGIAGFAYIGSPAPSPLVRMSAIGGALLRNFVSVRMVSVSTALMEHKDEPLTQRVLLLNDFHSSKTALPKWQVGLLLAMLEYRYTNELQTVVYADSLDAVEQDYGEEIHGLIRGSYVTMEW